MTAKDDIEILIVEDNSFQSVLLRRILDQNGYQVTCAKNGLQGLEMARKHKPNLVISDILMPEMDGYEMCYAIKRAPQLKQIPVILLTSLSDPEDIIRGLNAGADNYVTKPYNQDYLLQRIENLLSNVELGQVEPMGADLKIEFAGETHTISSGRWQILNLLISTFESAVQQNRELIKRTKELQASQVQYRAVLENTSNGFYRSTPEGIFLEVNPAYVEMLGYNTKDELLRQGHLPSLHHTPGDYETFLSELIENGTLKNRIAYLRKTNGSEIIVEENVRLVKDRHGNVLYFEGLVNDITDRARAEEQIKNYMSTLEQKIHERTAALEAANQVKSNFLASISHEFRTPLSTIIGFAEVLREEYFGPLSKQQQEYVAHILEGGNHLLGLINSVLNVARIEAGKDQLKVAKFSIKEVLERSLIIIKEDASKQGIRLKMDTDSDVEFMAGDSQKVQQTLLNLLSNATKFTPDGGTIRLSADLVMNDPMLQSGVDDKWIRISVEDTGIGIALSEQTKIFDAFYQVGDGLTNKTPGTGLGLTLSQQFVEMHGGYIWVESDGLDKGSRFSFVLPVGVGSIE